MNGLKFMTDEILLNILFNSSVQSGARIKSESLQNSGNSRQRLSDLYLAFDSTASRHITSPGYSLNI